MNVSKSVIIYHLVYENLMSSFSLFVPALTNELYKGQMGRIAVIGGSLEYDCFFFNKIELTPLKIYRSTLLCQ